MAHKVFVASSDTVNLKLEVITKDAEPAASLEPVRD
jgi:hypothetical protein